MKISRILIGFVIILTASYRPVVAAEVVDLTINGHISSEGGGSATVDVGLNEMLESATLLDDFNRSDGPIGSNWTNQSGTFQVVNQAAQGGSLAVATYNGVTSKVLEGDVECNGTSVQYTGFALAYKDDANFLFLKVQNQLYGTKFSHAAFYYGNNGNNGAFGPGFFSLSQEFSKAHMKVELNGTTVTMTFSNIDGGSGTQTYQATGAPATGGDGIGIIGYATIARIDNFTAGGSDQPVLSVNPVSRNVPREAGTTTFSVSNTGAGTMPWIAAVTPSSTWLSITSGDSGTNSGTINCSFTANPSTLARTATIRVTATGATGSPVDVTVTQAGSSAGSLAVSFDSLGLWIYNLGSAAWMQLSSVNPENMISSGSMLYVDFGASYGLYKWDGAAWTRLTTANPENMVASGSTLYVDFGASYGLYKWDGAAWAQLTSANPENMVASGSVLYVDFGTLGLYYWNGAVWSQLTGSNPAMMAILN